MFIWCFASCLWYLGPKRACSFRRPLQEPPIRLTMKEVNKLDAVLRRLCKPQGRGKKAPAVHVDDDIKKQWQKGGTARKDLLAILIEANGDKDCLMGREWRETSKGLGCSGFVGLTMWLYIRVVRGCRCQL